MSYQVTSYGTHNVVAPVSASSKAVGLVCEAPEPFELIVEKPNNKSNTDAEPYRIKWMGDRVNQPFATVEYRQLPSRDLYRGTKIHPTQRIGNDARAAAVSSSSIVMFEDQNTATGEILKVPFRASLSLEAPWDYVGMDAALFEKGFELALGMILSNFSKNTYAPGTSDLPFSEELWLSMFSGDLDPRDGSLE